jgi:hypothetical protein
MDSRIEIDRGHEIVAEAKDKSNGKKGRSLDRQNVSALAFNGDIGPVLTITFSDLSTTSW